MYTYPEPGSTLPCIYIIFREVPVYIYVYRSSFVLLGRHVPSSTWFAGFPCGRYVGTYIHTYRPTNIYLLIFFFFFLQLLHMTSGVDIPL